MKKMYSRWTNKEIKELFDFVEKETTNNATRAKAFSFYAEKSGRKPNSVRNYYYLELEYLQKNPFVAKKLEIDLTLHQKHSPKYFSKEETKNFMKEVENLVKQGNSVRKACLILSDGNIQKMVRLQNKYRSLKKENNQTFKEDNDFVNNIISMPQRHSGLTEQEINSLFLGLLKIIKANAKQESLNEYNKKTQAANEELRKLLVELNNKERQLKELRQNFDLLKQKNTKAQETITVLRAETASLIANNQQKMQALKKYANTITTTAKKQTTKQ